jgi:2-keto-4-pentenoate hydratase/2-oxohepta-3-ene-1,7-dioic acid hydratase in catechol pathway
MRYVRFEHAGTVRAGVVDGDRVRPFADPVDSLDALVALAPAERDRCVAGAGTGIPLADVRLLAPLQPKKNVFCVGRNYLAHAEEGARAQGVTLELPAVPTFFTKAPTAIADPGATLRLSPAVSSKYDWEAELGVVIGTRCRDVAEADVPQVIFGYTCFNDVTARDLQRAHGQWFKGKTLDMTAPIGPWIVDAADVGDPQQLRVTLRVNGVVKQDASTASMIFPVAAIVASLTRGLTLEPGDVIASGTPEGVGYARTPPEFLADGDVVEVEIEKIGTLRNTIRLV